MSRRRLARFLGPLGIVLALAAQAVGSEPVPTEPVPAEVRRQAETALRCATDRPLQVVRWNFTPTAGQCSFFGAMCEARFLHDGAIPLVLLPDGQVLGCCSKAAAERVLAVCALQEPPSAVLWTKLLLLFYADKDVSFADAKAIYDTESSANLEAVSSLEKRNIRFYPPTLTSGPEGLTLRFYVAEYDTPTVYRVIVLRHRDGRLEVKKSPVAWIP